MYASYQLRRHFNGSCAHPIAKIHCHAWSVFATFPTRSSYTYYDRQWACHRAEALLYVVATDSTASNRIQHHEIPQCKPGLQLLYRGMAPHAKHIQLIVGLKYFQNKTPRAQNTDHASTATNILCAVTSDIATGQLYIPVPSPSY